MDNNKTKISLEIEIWRGIAYNVDNFQALNTALYAGQPMHIFLNLPPSIQERDKRLDIEISLIPLSSFSGMPDWKGMKTPTNYVLVVIPDVMTKTVQMFNRYTMMSRGYFKAFGFQRLEAMVLEYFMNAVIRPDGIHSGRLERLGRKWAVIRDRYRQDHAIRNKK